MLTIPGQSTWDRDERTPALRRFIAETRSALKADGEEQPGNLTILSIYQTITILVEVGAPVEESFRLHLSRWSNFR